MVVILFVDRKGGTKVEKRSKRTRPQNGLRALFVMMAKKNDTTNARQQYPYYTRYRKSLSEAPDATDHAVYSLVSNTKRLKTRVVAAISAAHAYGYEIRCSVSKVQLLRLVGLERKDQAAIYIAEIVFGRGVG